MNLTTLEGDEKHFLRLSKFRRRALNIYATLANDSSNVLYASDGSRQTKGIFSYMNEDFKRAWHPHARISTMKVTKSISMKELLHLINVTSIDIWVLDVEGAEEAVLQASNRGCLKAIFT